MTTYLPLFPLELVAFPTEQVALHIFEKRYQQLLIDCEELQINFGIPTYINNTLQYGTEMELVNVVKRYPDGSSDILCKGARIFELEKFGSSPEDKLYAGGDVRYLENNMKGSETKKRALQKAYKKFYKALGTELTVPSIDSFNSYTLAHKAGFTLDQEYELLQIFSEDDRMDYVLNHLKVMTATLDAVDRTKELIALNGHFKYFDPLDFKNMSL